MENRIDGTMCGVSYGRYKVWRLICRVKCMETHIEGTLYGISYRGYNEWRLI